VEIPHWIHSIGFIILIFACAYVVLKLFQELLKFIRVIRTGYLVQGRIIGYEEDSSGDGTTYPAIITYTTIEGEKITGTSISSNGEKPTIGKEVWIVYDPNNPSYFYLQKSSVSTLIALNIGIVMFGVGMILLIVEMYKIS
jgi:hypothetical protein